MHVRGQERGDIRGGLRLLLTVSSVLYFISCVHFLIATTLTCFHFFATFALLAMCACFGFFTVKKLPLAQVSKLAAASTGFVVLTNLSLQYNSVGFYQIAKVQTGPHVICSRKFSGNY